MNVTAVEIRDLCVSYERRGGAYEGHRGMSERRGGTGERSGRTGERSGGTGERSGGTGERSGGTGERRDPAGRVEAVAGISLTVRRGEIHALLGGYGSGKTTVLETAAGLRRPSGGRVRVYGADPYTRRDTVRAGGVWREGGLFPGLTVAEVVDAWRRWTLDPLGCDEALALVGLRSSARARFESLSALDRRRLDLALALLGRSDVLFLDEPTAGLGRVARLEVWRTLRSLADAGIAILVATRDLEVTRCADQVSILKAGRVVSGAGAGTGTGADAVGGTSVDAGAGTGVDAGTGTGADAGAAAGGGDASAARRCPGLNAA